MLSAVSQPVTLHVCRQQLALQTLQPLPQLADLLLCELSSLQRSVLQLRLLAQLLGDVTQPGLHLRHSLTQTVWAGC